MPFRDITNVLKPLTWFMVFQLVLLLILVLLPQANDVYINLFEDGFWSNPSQALMIFVSITFICVSSGIGAKILTAIHPIEGLHSEFQKKILTWTINVLWYFPLMVFVIGFLKVAFKNFELFAFSGIVWTLTFSVLCFLLIQKIRALLRSYFEYEIEKQIREKKSESIIDLESIIKQEKDNLISRFDGFDSIFPSNYESAKQKLNYIRENYISLLKIISGAFTMSMLIAITFAFLPIEHYEFIGSAALVIFGMGTWITFYYCIEIFDKIYKMPLSFYFGGHNRRLNLKTIIFLWFCFCSFSTNHQVRLLKNTPEDNIAIKTLDQSLEEYKSKAYKNHKSKSSKKPPIIFIDIEGGASRTGIFGAMMLSVLSDTCKNFKDHIFGYSSISGGTLGANLFLSIDPEQKDSINNIKNHVGFSENFFHEDFLSPLIGTFMFGELIGYFLPFSVEKFDRGIVLEKSWENAWNKVASDTKKNQFSQPALDALTPNKKGFNPVVLINSYEIETGQRAILSNINLESKYFSGIVNLNEFIPHPIPYSSAIHLSARFPIISPTGEISDYKIKRHYGDGGYFESSGTLSLYELIKAKSDTLSKYFEIFVIHLKYESDNNKQENTNNKLFTEIADILDGAKNDNSGLSKFATENLRNYMQYNLKSPQNYIELNVGSNEFDVPLNWILSKKAIREVKMKCNSYLKENKKMCEFIKKIEP